MSGISSLNSLVSSDTTKVTQAQVVNQVEKDKQSDQTNSQQIYGPPYILSVSDAGQPYLNNDSATANNGTAVSGVTASTAPANAVPDKAPTSSDISTNGINGTAAVTSGNDASADNASSTASSATSTGASSDSSTNAASGGSSNSSSSSKSSSGSGGASAGGGVSVSSAEETSKRKVRPQVGPVGADEVVDENGNIDQGELKKLIAEQEQQAHRFDVNQKTQS